MDWIYQKELEVSLFVDDLWTMRATLTENEYNKKLENYIVEALHSAYTKGYEEGLQTQVEISEAIDESRGIVYSDHKDHLMKLDMHDKGGTSPCLHCECGTTWGATERALSYLVQEHNYNVNKTK